MEKIQLELSWGTLWRAFFFVLLMVILFLGRDVFLALFLAVVISAGLDVVVNFLERRGLPRLLGVLLIFLLGIIALILFAYTALPILIADVNTVVLGLNQSVTSLGLDSPVGVELLESLNDFITRVSKSFFSPQGGSPLGALSQLLGGLGLTIAVVVSAFYLSLSRDGIPRFIEAVFPSGSEKAALNVYERARRKIGRWFRAQIVLSLAVGLLAWVTLTLLGVRHAFLLATFAAIFEIVPYVGPIISGGAAVLVALTSSVSLAIYTLLAFLAIQQVENNFLTPLLFRRIVDLHPVVVIGALLVGAQVAGFLGLVIAVPAAVVFQEVVEEWSDKKRTRAMA